MAREAILIAAALQFLTWLPVPVFAWEEGMLSRSARYFPLVGALVGAMAATVWWGASLVLPAPVAAGLAIAALLALTGALHEDGLADTADALGGRASRDRALEIMRDSRIGTYGGAALVFSIGLRWACLASLPIEIGVLALIASGAVGRALMVPVSLLLGYARTSGAGVAVSGGIDGPGLVIALATTIALCLLIGEAGLLGLLIAGTCGWLVLRRLARRLGGYTGDGLGAIQQVGEIAFMVTIVAVFA